MAVPAQELRDDGVSVFVMGVGPVLREALRRLPRPWDSLIHMAAYADLRHHQDTLMEWICRGEWGGRSTPSGPPPREDLSPSLHVHHYRDSNSSQLPGAFHMPGFMLSATLARMSLT